MKCIFSIFINSEAIPSLLALHFLLWLILIYYQFLAYQVFLRRVLPCFDIFTTHQFPIFHPKLYLILTGSYSIPYLFLGSCFNYDSQVYFLLLLLPLSLD